MEKAMGFNNVFIYPVPCRIRYFIRIGENQTATKPHSIFFSPSLYRVEEFSMVPRKMRELKELSKDFSFIVTT